MIKNTKRVKLSDRFKKTGSSGKYDIYTYTTKAAKFDGGVANNSNSDILINSYLPVNNTTTISLWFNLQANHDGTLVSNNTMNELFIVIRKVAGKRILSVSDEHDRPIDVDLNEWHHYTFVKNGATLTTYVDGIMIHNHVSCTKNLTTAFGAKFGTKDTQNVYHLNGKINDVQIYNKALTADEIAKVSKGATIDGLVAHYEFNDPNDLGKDSTGKHNGVNYGAVQVDGPTKTVMIDKDVEVSFFSEK